MRIEYKVPSGKLVAAETTVESGLIKKVKISGDFFMYPEGLLWELERTLRGTPASKERILAKIENFYDSTGVLTPGVIPQDFTEAIMRALSAS